MNKKLFPHQVEALKWLENKPKAILGLDMGLGKTCIACHTIKPGERVLVICPASLKMNWKREINLWAPGHEIYIVKKKNEILPPEGIVVINYDLLGKKVKKRSVEANFDFTNFDRVILDEAHMIKNAKSVRSKISGRIIKQTPYALLLTGTPMERPIDLFVPLYSIGAIDMKYDTFGMNYCDPKKIFIGIREVWQYRGITNAQGLKAIVDPYMLRMFKEDVIDLPEKFIDIVGLDLPVGSREKKYNLQDIVKDPRPIGFEGLAELLHEQAIRKLPQAIAHIKMRLEENQKIFIVAKHTDVIDTLAEKLEKFNPVILDGRCSALAKDNAVHAFQNLDSCRVFIGQITAAGTGITLTAANHVIIVEPDWSYSNLMQVIDRCHRIGQKNKVNAEILTIDGSIDERVLYTTLEKKSFIRDIVGVK